MNHDQLTAPAAQCLIKIITPMRSCQILKVEVHVATICPLDTKMFLNLFGRQHRPVSTRSIDAIRVVGINLAATPLS